MFKQFRFCVLLFAFAFVLIGCATPTPTPAPTPAPPATFTRVPTLAPTATATPIPPTATATHTATPVPTVTRTPTAVPTPVLFRRYYTGSFLVYPVPPATEGCGTLAFENHLDLDLVVMLVRYSPTATRPSIHAAVFILARQFFRLLGLGPDNFLGEVYVAAGEDWDPDLARFTRKNQYLRVTDRLMFFASPSCSHYVIKVASGAPDLQPIPENQFPGLRQSR
ncbi:MAG: hypothetical protein FJ009_07890 [Chloroflexi bacterium]|nr:hypothetical protein [Chloroflexota bacterium]